MSDRTRNVLASEAAGGPVLLVPRRGAWQLYRSFLQVPGWLSKVQPDVVQEAGRVRVVERDLGLPVRLVVLGLLSYGLLWAPWFNEAELLLEGVQEVVHGAFVVYAGFTLIGALFLMGMDELPFPVVREVVLALSLMDSCFLALVAVVTGGFDSSLFWVFVVLIVRNSLSMPGAARQIMANVLATMSFLGAGLVALLMVEQQVGMLDEEAVKALYPNGPEPLTEPVLLRMLLLVLLTTCCYGVEVLFDRERRLEEEARESAQRQHQLESAGRLAAEIAHQLKNPLGIINNAAYTLQKTVKEGKAITQQIAIIREEVQRSDRIITELMGYARLVEGKVERLEVAEELERALEEVFPPAAKFEVQVHRDYASGVPALLAQRIHVTEIFVNLMQNAREAMQGKGHLHVGVGLGENGSIVVRISDDGPGIGPENRERVFEAYFTTKDQGTGLGLAIVKNNVELYGGRVRVESELGKGATFRLEFPVRVALRLRH